MLYFHNFLNIFSDILLEEIIRNVQDTKIKYIYLIFLCLQKTPVIHSQKCVFALECSLFFFEYLRRYGNTVCNDIRFNSTWNCIDLFIIYYLLSHKKWFL